MHVGNLCKLLSRNTGVINRLKMVPKTVQLSRIAREGGTEFRRGLRVKNGTTRGKSPLPAPPPPITSMLVTITYQYFARIISNLAPPLINPGSAPGCSPYQQTELTTDLTPFRWQSAVDERLALSFSSTADCQNRPFSEWGGGGGATPGR